MCENISDAYSDELVLLQKKLFVKLVMWRFWKGREEKLKCLAYKISWLCEIDSLGHKKLFLSVDFYTILLLL